MAKFKRIMICPIVVIVLLSTIVQTTVFATANTYRIDEAKLKVSIPSDYTVVTRNTPSNAEIFTNFGLSYSEFMNNMKSGSIYLDAVSNLYSEEIVVTCKENILNDFALLSDTMLGSVASITTDEMEKFGVSVIKYDIYHHSQAKFIRIYWVDSANSRYGLQYFTVRDNIAMNFTLQSYEDSINSRQESVMKTIVDSVKYDTASPVVPESKDTDAFIYTDSDSGVKFTVPANWVEDEFNEEREFLDAKFASTKEDGLIMVFSSTDAWSEMSSADKVGLTRSDINNSMLSKSDVAEIYGTTEDKVSLYMYNGVEYYKCESTANKEMYGLSLDITMNHFLHVKDGWIYTFQFGGTSDHKLYSDFEKLIRSVEYPMSDTYEPDNDNDDYSYIGDMDNKNDDNSYIDDTDKNDEKPYIGVIILVLIILVVGAVCLILRIVDREKQKNKN